MSSTTSPPSHILLIGAGVFGLSTALTILSRPAYAHTELTILDASPSLPNPSGSSVDASRIVRADYACLPYASLALQAQKLWRDTSPSGWGGQGRYHQPGFLLSADEGEGEYMRASMANVMALAEQGMGLEVEQIVELKGREAMRRASGFEGITGDTGYVNWGSGWADAEACVRYALEKVMAEGNGRVEIHGGTKVRRLLYEQVGGSSRCVGAELEHGVKMTADLVIVAAGAWSPTLVNLQGRAVATGQALAYLDISEEEEISMQHRPTIMNMSRGMFIIPPRGRELKIARHGFGYRNLRRIPVFDEGNKKIVNGQNSHDDSVEVSVPAVGIEIPQEAREACREALRGLVPEMAERPFSRTRICWYCDTPNGDFLIDYHPCHEGLFIATGGSGHGFKFFPVIGDKIVDAIERRLDPELKSIWRWEPEFVADLTCCEDGSRAGPRGMSLDDELQKGKR